VRSTRVSVPEVILRARAARDSMTFKTTAAEISRFIREGRDRR
jgi:hypothetical protein